MAAATEAAQHAGAPGGLARMSASSLLEGYRLGRFTPTQVIEEVIAALERADRHCRVMVTPMFDAARAQAELATKAWAGCGRARALEGVPVTVKDLVYVAGVPALGGSPVHRGFVPAADAAVVTRLREAGAIITCKTTTCEAGYKLTADSPVSGVTRNPWNPARTSGGSSGGAAAAVAAGCGPLAVGTDGVGSIRVPASFCGAVGIKPTFGLVPRAPGFTPPSWASLAHTGPIARTVGDLALLLEVLAGYDRRDAASLPLPGRRFDTRPGSLAGLRIACSADLGYAAVAPEVRSAFAAAVSLLQRLGAQVVPDAPDIDPAVLEHTLRPIAYVEQAAAALERDAASMACSEAEYRAVVEHGRHYSGIEYVDATHRRAALRAAFVRLFDRVQVLVTPTVATTAFAAGEIGVDEIDGREVDRHLGWSPFSWPMNLAGLPALTINCGFDAAGLPVGLQIVAPWLDEDVILRVAAAFEAASDVSGRWPSLA